MAWRPAPAAHVMLSTRLNRDPAARCPACAATDVALLRRIDVHEQHARYFPGEAETAARLTRTLSAIALHYDLVRCRACALIFAQPMAAPSHEWYEAAYQALGVRGEPRWEFGEVLRHLTRRETVFEFGCGMGPFLRACRARGILARGVDFSEYAVRVCREDGLEVTLGHADRPAPTPSDAASVAVSFQVLEHLDNPDALFVEAARATRQDSVLWVSVPTHRRLARALDYIDPWDEPPHHLTMWTDQALAAIAHRNGWRLEELTYAPFTWRSGLFDIASHHTVYERLHRQGRLRHPIVERLLRLTLYPHAAAKLIAIDRTRVTGISMLARFRR